MITKFVEHLLFPTTVYQNEIPVNENEFTTMMEMDYERSPGDNGYMTKYKRILTLLPHTRKAIEKHIEYYAYEVLGISHRHKFYITTSWVNKHVTGDKAHSHFHANSVISGCYYLKMPESGGDICFPKPTNHNNFLSDMFNFETKVINERNTSEYKIEVKENMLILFPSQTRHFTQINNSIEDRYSLAFNVWVRGDMGNHDIEKIKL